jgi:electron transport complex protein RnfC
VSIITFKGGIHPPDTKEATKNKPISLAKVPSRLIVPLVQHIGSPCKVSVTVGQAVKKGEVIGTAGGFVSAPVHSPVSGKVTGFCDVPHPAGMMVPGIAIENDNRETWIELKETPDYTSLSPKELCERIHAAGIVGMGGGDVPDPC